MSIQCFKCDMGHPRLWALQSHWLSSATAEEGPNISTNLLSGRFLA